MALQDKGMTVVAHIDLAKLAAALEIDQRHPELVHAINRAAAAGSIHMDLKTAADALRSIEQIVEKSKVQFEFVQSELAESTMIGALFTQAIVFYARATATMGKRPKLLGEAKLTAVQRAAHREAIDLRNSAIAHFGRGEALAEGPLVREAVLMTLIKSPTGPKRQVSVYTTYAQNKTAFAARLADLINERLSDISGRQQRLFDEAGAALEKALKADPTLGNLLRRFEFDVDAFCVSPQAADHLRALLNAEAVDDITYTVAVSVPK